MLQEQIDSARQKAQTRRSATAKVATILGAIFSLTAAVLIVAGGNEWHMGPMTSVHNGWLVPGTLALACAAVSFVITRWKLGMRGSAITVLAAICLWLLCALYGFRYPVSFAVVHVPYDTAGQIEGVYLFNLRYSSEPMKITHYDKEGDPGLWGSRTAFKLLSMRSDGEKCRSGGSGCHDVDCEVAKVWWFAGASYSRQWQQDWSLVPRSLEKNCKPAEPAHMEQYDKWGIRIE